MIIASGVLSQTNETASKPASNLDYWLNRAEPTTTSQPASRPSETNPFGRTDRFSRSDALPGVVVLSDGKVLPGGVFTTRDKDWEVWSASKKRWRHIPPIVVLSIRAVVVEEGMEKEWRWKEMGRNERVFTGRAKPVRRLLWRFHLIDDSYITGAVKGQPLWVETAGKRHGPFVLHERTKGKLDQTLKDLIYVKQVVISRRAMEEVLKIQLNASSP
jgi:hypothetical protein